TEDPRPMRARNPRVPAGLADLVEQLLAKDRAQRPQSAEGGADRVVQVGQSLTTPAPPEPAPEGLPVPPAPPPPGAEGRTPRWIALAGALAALLALAAWVVMKVPYRDGNSSPVQSPENAEVVRTAEDSSLEKGPKADAGPAQPVRIDLLALADPAKDTVN